MDKIVKTFKDIVQIDSPSGQESQMRNWLIDWLDSIGFQYKVDKTGNLYAYNHKETQSILLCAHMDTVEPGKNIKPIVQNNIIKSSGNTILGADNKAAIAAIVDSVEKYTSKTPITKQRSIELVFSVKEETGGGIENFPFDWISSKQAFIFDFSKPLGGIVLASPFIENFHIKLVGKAAHSSTPSAGINALATAADILNQIPVGLVDEQTTINFGKIQGGIGINTIPSEVSLDGEVRSYDKALFDNHLARIKEISQSLADKSKVKLIFSKSGYCPGYSHKEDGKLVQETKKILKDQGLNIQFYAKSGVSDANILNSMHINTLNLSDATKDTHTTNESIKIEDLEKLSSIIYQLILKI